MRMKPVHEEKLGDFSIKIYPDSERCDPREWDNLGKMVCFHKRYTLGDKHNLSDDDFNGWDDLEKYLREEEGALVILPLYLYDHSGITMGCEPFSCRWDSGQVGFIYATREAILAEYGGKIITRSKRERAEKVLRGEVECYDQGLRGEVYGYEVTDGDEVDDSCWGFLGEMSYCLEEARNSARYYQEQRERAQSEVMALAGMEGS